MWSRSRLWWVWSATGSSFLYPGSPWDHVGSFRLENTKIRFSFSPGRGWVVENETRSVIQKRNREAVLRLFPLPSPGSSSPVSTGAVSWHLSHRTRWRKVSNRIWGSRPPGCDLGPWGWKRRRKGQVDVAQVPKASLSFPPHQHRGSQREFLQVINFLGEGKSEQLGLGELHHLPLLNRLDVPHSFMFCSTPPSPETGRQSGVRKGTELEVRTWRFENSMPCLCWVMGGLVHVSVCSRL